MLKTKRLILACLVLALGLAVGFVLTQIFKPQDFPVATPLDPSTHDITATPQTAVPLGTSNPYKTDDFVACTMDAMQCPDGSYVGRSGSNCEFVCPSGDTPNSNEIVCTDEQRKADACIEIYAPVCAQVQVECITTLCNPVPQTFPNSCFACASERVISYADGSCAGDIVTE